MFSLTVFVGSAVWQFLYKTEEGARTAFAGIGGSAVSPIAGPNGTVMTLAQHGSTATAPIYIADDFGNEMMINPSALNGAVFENLEETALAMCERALHQQRTQIKAGNMAQADATIRTARFSQGPAMIDPTMGRANGMFPRQ